MHKPSTSQTIATVISPVAHDNQNTEEKKILGLGDGGSFTLFSKLPIELRLEIWKLTYPGPRVLVIKGERDKKGLLTRHWLAHARIPVALQTCSESRLEA